MRATKIPPGAGNRRASLVSGRYRRARFRSAESFSFQQTDGPITSAVRASGSEGPFGRRPNMEHRGVEYRIIQGIKRGFWKWSIETEIGTKSGTSDSKEAAMAVASDLPVEQPTKFECSAGFRGDSQGASRRPCRVSFRSQHLADFVAEVGCREPRTVIDRARCDAAAGAGDDGAAQTRPGAAVLFVLP